MSLIHRRRRAASAFVAASVTLALPVVGATFVASPAHSADPVEDCIAPFPVADLEDGDAVTGLTVTRGTTPEGFTGEILGVLEDGVAPGVDMILAELDMPEFERTGGIWAGMSGSPVYAEDGRLIGAVAYGLSITPSPIAGITPFEQMDDYLAAEPRPVRLGKADAREVAARTGVTQAQAEAGLRELPMPVGVTGVSGRRLAQVKAQGPGYLHKRNLYTMGRAEGRAAGPETMVAGGNIGASASYGDITFGGVGTVTSVCDGRIVGFGHPFDFAGPTTEGLHPADAIYVQPEGFGGAFKVANIAPPVGTITDDRLTGITGEFGAAPDAMTISSDITYGARNRVGSTDVYVPAYAPDIAIYQIFLNHDTVVDGVVKGSETYSYVISGTQNGTPFSLRFADRSTGTDLGFLTSFDVADLVYQVGQLEGVEVTSVAHEADAYDDTRTHKLYKIEQRRGGQWFRVTKKAPAIGLPGKQLLLRAVVGGPAGVKTVPLPAYALPKKAKGKLVISALGGDSSYSYVEGDTVAELRAQLAKKLRHDQVRVEVGTADKISGGGFEEEGGFRAARGGKAKPVSFVQSRTSTPLDHVVSGSLTLPVVVR